VAFEGEFAFTEGHAQELKTIALAQQVGKRLRLFFSYNNAGIDDSLIGGVIPEKYGAQYDIANQFQSWTAGTSSRSPMVRSIVAATGWVNATLNITSPLPLHHQAPRTRTWIAVFKQMEDWTGG
jgi:hypothetical protein